MFSLEELEHTLTMPDFIEDFESVKQSLVNNRLKQPVLITAGSSSRLSYLTECVLASAALIPADQRHHICRTAAEISETLAAASEPRSNGSPFRVRAALLYELANLPALAASILDDSDLPELVSSFFKRKGIFGKLEKSASSQITDLSTSNLGLLALIEDSLLFGKAIQKDNPKNLLNLKNQSVSSTVWRICEHYNIGVTASEMQAFASLLNERISRATVSTVDSILMPSLRKIAFPSELLPAQHAAIKGGLLDKELTSWGFAAPTGSGKTFLTRLLISEVLAETPDCKIIYLVPSKALVNEISASFQDSLEVLGYKTLALSAQLIDLEEREKIELDDASVVIMTPEKADMLLRLDAEFIKQVKLAVIDEAHHIESGTRGALLELYLWRLKHMLPLGCRYVFLSAVSPNIKEIASWIDAKSNAVNYNLRPTRMRVGVYKLAGRGVRTRGFLKYTDNTTVEVVPTRAEITIRRGICQLSEFLQKAGSVLIVAKGKKESENIANELKQWLTEAGSLNCLSESQLNCDTYRSLDACLEREMYSDVSLRSLLKHRIAYHHAGLPPAVRQGIEKAIRERLIDYVVATTTLAEGVNFPFSSVIVQSLALREPPERGRPSKYNPVTPRTFWNIAGRAGRPGFDAEGQVILFEPSLGLEKIRQVIDPYINPDMASLSPVHSALATAINEIHDDLSANSYSVADLEKIILPENMSRRVKGAINLLRVGLVHAKAADLIKSPEEIVEHSFAAHFLTQPNLLFANQLMSSQETAIANYLEGGDTPTMKELAELGLSLQTLEELREYVRNMSDWQFDNLEKLFYGSAVNLDQAKYVIGPVAKHMSELEGPSLGGFLSDLIVKWLSGVTFTSICSQIETDSRLEDLVAVVYSRVQYLLPWGLWATDWLLEKEAQKRGVNYSNHVKNLAYLADVGVPNFDALHLTHLRIERVDATRLSNAYTAAGGLNTGVDCISWILAQTEDTIESIIRGLDNRRIAHKFFETLDRLRIKEST